MNGENNGWGNISWPNPAPSNPFGYTGGKRESPVSTDTHVWYHGVKGPIPVSILTIDRADTGQTPADWKRALDRFGALGSGEAIPAVYGFDPNP